MRIRKKYKHELLQNLSNETHIERTCKQSAFSSSHGHAEKQPRPPQQSRGPMAWLRQWETRLYISPLHTDTRLGFTPMHVKPFQFQKPFQFHYLLGIKLWAGLPTRYFTQTIRHHKQRSRNRCGPNALDLLGCQLRHCVCLQVHGLQLAVDMAPLERSRRPLSFYCRSGTVGKL